MLLGAGRGTRLGPLGKRVPKVLVDLGGEPLLARQLRYLGSHGVDHVVVNAHHLSGQLESWAKRYTGPPTLTVLVEPELLGTAGGTRNALALLGPEPFVVLYGDVLVDEPLGPLLAAHRAARAMATVTVYASAETEGKGTVAVEKAGRVTAFVEKGDPGSGPALINAGLYVIEPELLAGLGPGESDFGHDVFPAALAAGRPLAAYVLSEPVIDVGTPEGLERARGRVG